MKLFKKIYSIALLLFVGISGCVGVSKNKVDRDYIYPIAHAENEMENLIQQLTSANFFEYTQAARKLILKGPDAVPVLYQNRHLTREVDGAIIPVCMSIIEIIFSESDVDRVRSYVDYPLPEIAQIARKELEKRQKT